ncbi:MAG: UPF0182 family protein [Chloroflexi bacterium]|nr:UPF0182 family protein [Chloroflexota bacterium]
MRSTNPLQPQILDSPGRSGRCWASQPFWLFGFGAGVSAQWETVLQFVYQTPFGTVDPLFNQDVSFYLFSLPLFEFLQGWFSSLLFVTLAGVLSLYALK